jgi:hypothetical protein
MMFALLLSSGPLKRIIKEIPITGSFRFWGDLFIGAPWIP